MENTRFRRRTGNRTKSILTKYTSHPELQLLTPGHPQFQCQQCGFVNTLFPLCLCCTWSSKQAEHEFNSTIPRARRASAPAIVLKLCIEEKKDSKNPHDSRRRLVVSRSMIRFPPQVGIREEEDETPASMKRRSLSNGHQKWDGHSSPIASTEAVAKATSSSPLLFDRAQTASQGEGPASRSEREFRGSIPCSLPSEEEPTLSVERQSAIMPPTRSSRNLRVKRSHQVLLIDIHDSKMSSTSGDDDDEDHIKINDEQQQRTIRRRKHLNVLQKPIPDTDVAEPIAISLNIHKPSLDLDSKSLEPVPLSRSLSHPQSATSESSNGDTTTLLAPALPPSSPSSKPPSLVTYAPSSSPVRIGHPSRPYYSAIRKNGISPPPSRPSSLSGPSPSSPRPQSYTPPSSLPMPSTSNAASTSPTTRHLSMSSMFVSPALASSPGSLSVFSVMDDADLEDEDNDGNMPVLPPTPAPGRTRFSLSSSAKRRFSHGPLLTTPPAGAGHRLHNHSQSLSQARSKALGGSIGFSMSGETELRMALAMGAADSGERNTGFRFRETVVPTSVDSQSDATPENQTRATRSGLMDKVKKLRQGLKDLLFTTPTTTTTTSTTA